MRTRRLGVLIGLGVTLVAAVPVATAAPRAAHRPPPAKVFGFMPVGTLDYIWTGDPARGCAAAGLCGVAGSLQVVTGNSSSGGGPGFPPIELQDDNAVARVDQPGPDGVEQPCADLVPYDVSFVLRHEYGGRLRAVPEPGAPEAPSAGQCAGPTAGDLLSIALPAAKLGRRGYQLSGSVSFGAGPFAVKVVSRIRALFVSAQSFGAPAAPSHPVSGPRPPKPRAALAELADVGYRVTAVRGGLAATYAGLAQPFCASLDACGATGAVTLALRVPDQRLEFSGSRLVKRRVRSRQALADLRSGRLRLDSGVYAVPFAGKLTGTVTRAGAAPCRDTVSDSVVLAEGTTRTAYRLGSSEILGVRPLAGARVGVGDLGAPRLTVVLNAAGAFRGRAYAGERSGSITLTLVRSHVFAGTRRVRIIDGQVIGFG